MPECSSADIWSLWKNYSLTAPEKKLYYFSCSLRTHQFFFFMRSNLWPTIGKEDSGMFPARNEDVWFVDHAVQLKPWLSSEAEHLRRSVIRRQTWTRCKEEDLSEKLQFPGVFLCNKVADQYMETPLDSPRAVAVCAVGHCLSQSAWRREHGVRRSNCCNDWRTCQTSTRTKKKEEKF